jgi:uncharacterized protein (DUF58 family)
MLTPKGAILLGGSLALIAAGLVRIDGVLITLGVAGLLLFGGAFLLGRRNLRRLALTLRAPSRIFADTPFDLRLTLQNRRTFLDAFGIGITLNLSRQSHIKTSAVWTAAGSASTVQLSGSIPGRGSVAEHPFTLSGRFPLDLFRLSASGTATHEILVFPRPLVPREFFTHGALHDASTLPGTTPGNAPGEPRGIRPWQPGDPAKQIHWPASARSLSRLRGLRIRENDPPGFHPQHCTILFHSFGTSGELIRDDRFERALSLACGALRYLRDHGIPATLLADFLEWHPLPVLTRAGMGNALVALARAQRANDTEAHNLKSALDIVPAEHSLLLLSDMPVASWSHLLPSRPALPVDIRQHKYGHKQLQTQRVGPSL